MSTDVAEWPSPRVLRWLIDHDLSAADALTFVCHGITDADVIVQYVEHADTVSALPNGYKVKGTDDLATLVVIGAEVFVADYDNRDEWRIVATLAVALDARWKYGLTGHELNPSQRTTPDGGYRQSFPGIEAVTVLYEAGYAPQAARKMVEVADRHGLDVDAFGLGDEIRATQFEDMADAGMRNRADVKVYLDAGLTVDNALALRSSGVTATHLHVAQHLRLAPETWIDTLAGIPVEWLGGNRDRGTAWRWDTSGNLLRSGFTLDDLHHLATHGWADITAYSVTAIRYGSGSRSGGHITLDGTEARRLADAGVTYAKASALATAITTGKGSGSDRYWTPGPLTLAPTVTDLIRLHEAGVSAASITDYRWCGAHDVNDVLTAVAAGIDGKRVKFLRETYGSLRDRFDKSRSIRRFTDLLMYHREESARTLAPTPEENHHQ